MSIEFGSREEADMFDRMQEAADAMKKADDDLLKAVGMIAAGGNITIIRSDSLFGDNKPLIMLPGRLYDRLCELFPAPR